MDTNEQTPLANAEQPIAEATVETSVEEQVIVERTPLLSTEEVQSADREKLFDHYKRITAEYTVTEVAAKAKEIQDTFEAQTKTLRDEKFQNFLAAGGEEKDFDFGLDALALQMKELTDSFAAKRKAAREAEEKVLIQNALAKRNVIKNITDLVAVGDAAKTRTAVLEHIKTWKTIGPMPRNEASEINSAFKKIIDEYFAALKMHHELRDLDMKRNLEAKQKLCEQAEALSEDSKVVNAFHTLRELQKQWKAIGHVPANQREEIWQRFKKAADTIYQRFHAHEAENKTRAEENYTIKVAMCEEVEALLGQQTNTRKLHDEAMKKVDEARAKWRTIGFAPKAVNDEIYKRFCTACSAVYSARREYYRTVDTELKQNLEKKTALCEKAEAIMNSTDWRNTTSQFVALQKQWKGIGPAPRKDSDAVWTRFRKACDTFFDAKEKQLGGKNKMEQNLADKKALIEELRQTAAPADIDEHFKLLQQFQQRWNSIGFVPAKEKVTVNNEFNNLLNERYESLNTDDANRNLQRFRARMELAAADPEHQGKVERERKTIINRLKQLETDIVQLQNNVGFFAKGSNSESLVAEVNRKIQTAKQNIDILNQKLDILDSLEE